MTHPLDVARGRDIVARWCDLAERRLEHLTDMFETGRWRRYHTERAFLENLQEAKAAVETWRDLLVREASRDNSPLDISWLGRRRTLLRDRIFPDQAAHRPASVPAQTPAERPPNGVIFAPQASHAATGEPRSAPSAFDKPGMVRRGPDAPALDMPALDTPALDAASKLKLDLGRIGERYPLLRNAL